MYGYRDHCLRTAYSDSTFYCPYSMYRIQCPFCSGYRPKAEEFQLQQEAAPKTPPPNYTPNLSDLPTPSLTKVEFGALAPCIYKFTYLWLKNGKALWSYIVRIGRTSLSGWRYEAGQWVPFSVDLSQIKNYFCS